MGSHRGLVPFIKKYFGKDDWNAGMVSSVCLSREFPLIAARVWSRTSRRGGCTLPGWLAHLGVGFSFLLPHMCTINTHEKVFHGKDSALGMKISDCSRQIPKPRLYSGKRRSKRALFSPNLIPQLNGNVLGNSTMENSRNETKIKTELKETNMSTNNLETNGIDSRAEGWKWKPMTQ